MDIRLHFRKRASAVDIRHILNAFIEVIFQEYGVWITGMHYKIAILRNDIAEANAVEGIGIREIPCLSGPATDKTTPSY